MEVVLQREEERCSMAENESSKMRKKSSQTVPYLYFILFYFILVLRFIFGDNDKPMSGERALI